MGAELRILSSWSRRIGARGFPPVGQRLWESLELWQSLEFFFFLFHKIFEFHKFSRQSCRRKLKFLLFFKDLDGSVALFSFSNRLKQKGFGLFKTDQNKSCLTSGDLDRIRPRLLLTNTCEDLNHFRWKWFLFFFLFFTSAEGQTVCMDSAQNKKTLIFPKNWQEEKWLFVSFAVCGAEMMLKRKKRGDFEI